MRLTAGDVLAVRSQVIDFEVGGGCLLLAEAQGSEGVRKCHTVPGVQRLRHAIASCSSALTLRAANVGLFLGSQLLKALFTRIAALVAAFESRDEVTATDAKCFHRRLDGRVLCRVLGVVHTGGDVVVMEVRSERGQ